MMRSGIKPGHPLATLIFFVAFVGFYVSAGLLAITFSAPLSGKVIEFHTPDLIAAAAIAVSLIAFFASRRIIRVLSVSEQLSRQYTKEMVAEHRAQKRAAKAQLKAEAS